MAVVERFAHIPTGTVTAGGITAPAPGTSESWTVTAATAFPVANAAGQFHVCDPAANSELILVTVGPGGTGAGQSWTVTRGADGTTPVVHAGGFTIFQVTPASFLNAPTFSGLVTTSGLACPVKSVTSAYTATANDFFIEGDASVSGTFVVTLPTSSVQTGQIYVVKKVDGGSNEIDVTPATGTIDGRATIPLRFFNSQTVAQWDGSTWKVLGGYFATGGIDSISVSFFEQGIAVGLLRSETANYTTQPNDFEIACDATSAAFTVTLGSTAQFAQLIAVKKIDSSAHAVTVAAGSGLIDGAASVSLTAKNQAVFVQWDGSNWQVLASNGLTSGAFLPLAGGTMTGGEVLAAGTTSLIPLQFQSGTLNTTASAGAEEYDGTCFYATAAASTRQVVDTEQFTILSAAYTLANNNSAQPLFNATANGAVTLAAGTWYFDLEADLTGLAAAAHTIELGFGGTASVSSIKYWSDANTGAAATLAAWQTIITTTTAATAVAAAGATTTIQFRARGVIRIGTGGTLIPQITQLNNSAAAVVSANSWFRCWPVGSATVTNVGDWS